MDRKNKVEISMEDQEAIEILTKLLDQHSFTAKEKKALATAIGALGWTKLGKARLKNIINARKAERAEELGSNK